MNDEGRVLEENLPDVPHLQAPDRVDLARSAVEELESEFLVLDDGFQHRRLARDLDLVLLDALDPFGLGRIFPRGLLREPVGSLRRAGVVVLSRADLVDEATRRAIRARAERAAGPLRWADGPACAARPDRRRGAVDPARPTGQGRKVGGVLRDRQPRGVPADPRRARAGPRSGSGPSPTIILIRRPTWPTWPPGLRSLGAELALTTQKDLVKLRAAEPRPGAAPRPADRPGSHGRGRDARPGALGAACPRERMPRDPSRRRPRRRDRRALDLDALRYEPLADRPSKVGLADLGRASAPGVSLDDWLDGLPDLLAGRGLKRLRDAIVRAHEAGAPVVAALGGHVVKTGCGPYLIDWIDRGILDGLALNGSAAIHDLELAIAGRTSEDVGPRLMAGTFGFARETSDLFAAGLRPRGRRRARAWARRWATW